MKRASTEEGCFPTIYVRDRSGWYLGQKHGGKEDCIHQAYLEEIEPFGKEERRIRSHDTRARSLIGERQQQVEPNRSLVH